MCPPRASLGRRRAHVVVVGVCILVANHGVNDHHGRPRAHGVATRAPLLAHVPVLTTTPVATPGSSMVVLMVLDAEASRDVRDRAVLACLPPAASSVLRAPCNPTLPSARAGMLPWFIASEPAPQDASHDTPLCAPQAAAVTVTQTMHKYTCVQNVRVHAFAHTHTLDRTARSCGCSPSSRPLSSRSRKNQAISPHDAELRVVALPGERNILAQLVDSVGDGRRRRRFDHCRQRSLP